MFTPTEKQKLTIQYEPLINKLTSQFYHKTAIHQGSCIDWDSIKSMAYEGFALALNKYDQTRSNMSFLSYASFEMRNNILTRLTEESRTVKMPFEEQKKRKAAGKTLFTSVSIDHSNTEQGEDLAKPKSVIISLSIKDKFSDGNLYDYLYQRLEDQFTQRECDIFYMTFGLKGYEETPNMDIAKKFNVSNGLISQKKKKIIDYIRKDRELCEMLSNLL